MRTITEEMIQDALKYGIKRADAERGYYKSCCSDYGNGATHIQRIDEMDVFFSDWDAAAQAEKDGIKIIRDLVLAAEHDAPYIDTPANRLLLKPFILRKIDPEQQRKVSLLTDEEVAFISQHLTNNAPDAAAGEPIKVAMTFSEVAEKLKQDACSRIENLINDAPDSEQVAFFVKDYSCYLTVQTCDDGYDYTFYNCDFEGVDGGQLDNPEMSMAQVIYELLSEIDAQSASLELYDYETIIEKEEIIQKNFSIANQAMFHAKGVLLDAGLSQDITITGFRLYDSPDDAPDQLDYDVLLQYEGNIREDDFFNLLSQHKCIIDGRLIDFNPIRPDKSGTIEEYIKKLAKWKTS